MNVPILVPVQWGTYSGRSRHSPRSRNSTEQDLRLGNWPENQANWWIGWVHLSIVLKSLRIPAAATMVRGCLILRRQGVTMSESVCRWGILSTAEIGKKTGMPLPTREMAESLLWPVDPCRRLNSL